MAMGVNFSVRTAEPSPGRLMQVFCGNAAKSIAVWEPPCSEMQDKVLLNGHTGWVRALAAEGRWLFRYATTFLARSLLFPRPSSGCVFILKSPQRLHGLATPVLGRIVPVKVCEMYESL